MNIEQFTEIFASHIKHPDHTFSIINFIPNKVLKIWSNQQLGSEASLRIVITHSYDILKFDNFIHYNDFYKNLENDCNNLLKLERL